ncbi:2-octaprenylphenol hydroxylase [Aquicella siphonis]|uniref:2-octaprenylphenol hydroxylase n=1 Tax=Aquicella siphonis TaxID=254247 RepID=A0A5E4PEQ5_9COXI|nr:UbiH/UbiF/VisC/COQ6 family ubiquinone biosynthesis hydroxylase [Aquicella siphonis]VVC74903.1 2-octaprenylphenol hydroxylase [Aquicella siphonis]
MQKTTHDIVIMGGGMVGSALACMLAQKTSLSVAVLESAPRSQRWSAAHYHHRVSAIAQSSRRIFQALNVWQGIHSKRVSPFRKIEVWDAAGKGEVTFDSKEIAEPLLGYIIENILVQAELEEKARQSPRVDFISPVNMETVSFHENHITLISRGGRKFSARLAVAADGANSWLRGQAGIEIEKEAYHQQAIVAAVETALPHLQTARQVFLESGPLAFLPLREEKSSSIVWSLGDDEAQRLLALDEPDFISALGRAFDYRLGEVTAASKLHAFPLHRQHAAHYVKPRVALVGDAAHTIHPMAGQGVNMGLLDAASLADIIADAVSQHRDIGDLTTLRRYERWRKADNLVMLAGVDMLKRLFANERKSIQCARSLGLNAANRIKWIKNVFTRHAVGDRAGLPDLAVEKSS